MIAIITVRASGNLNDLIAYVFRAHGEQAKRPSKAFRKFDGRTPYGVHPTWGAMTILTETVLSEQLRIRGAHALLLHDVLEDTTAELPADTPNDVRTLVEEMTFKGGSDEEQRLIWSRSAECRLLKLYDKVSNLLDGSWMDPKKKTEYVAYTRQLVSEVARQYGEHLNIIRIARAICQ